MIVEPEDLYMPLFTAHLIGEVSIGSMIDGMIKTAKEQFTADLVTTYGVILVPEWFYMILLGLRGDASLLRYRGFSIQAHKLPNIMFEVPQ